jgi:hypothetical protein
MDRSSTWQIPRCPGGVDEGTFGFNNTWGDNTASSNEVHAKMGFLLRDEASNLLKSTGACHIPVASLLGAW